MYRNALTEGIQEGSFSLEVSQMEGVMDVN